MVAATLAFTMVITRTPRKLKTAAIKMALRALIARVETQVAMALGASVQPFTSTTPSVSATGAPHSPHVASSPRQGNLHTLHRRMPLGTTGGHTLTQ